MKTSARNIILLLIGIFFTVSGYVQLPDFFGYASLALGAVMIILALLGWKNQKVY